MSRIFGIVFTIVFVLFFTTYQSSANEIQDKVEALESERVRMEEKTRKNLELALQITSEKIERLKENGGDNTYQIAELEWEKHKLEQAIDETDTVISEIGRVVKELPEKVARGEATKESNRGV